MSSMLVMQGYYYFASSIYGVLHIVFVTCICLGFVLVLG